MIIRFFLVFFFVLSLFSCNQKSIEGVVQKEKGIEVEVVKKKSKFLYGINVDSFKVETNKIKLCPLEANFFAISSPIPLFAPESRVIFFIIVSFI